MAGLIDLTKLENGDLRLSVVAEGDTPTARRRSRKESYKRIKETIKDVENRARRYGSGGYYSALRECLEDQLCNGWEFSTIDRLGALSEAPFLSEECDLGDHGDYENVGKIYYYEPYQVYDPFEELLRHGHVDFQGYEEKEQHEV